MLSLAGIPPLAGFFGKFYLFASALGSGGNDLGLLWLVILAVAFSAISLYYYLQVLKQIYIVPASVESVASPSPIITRVALSLMAVLVLLLGCAPDLLLGSVVRAIQVAGL